MNDIRISIRRKYYLDTNFVLHLPYILSRVRPIRPKPNPPSFLVIADRNLLLKTRFQFQRLQEALDTGHLMREQIHFIISRRPS